MRAFVFVLVAFVSGSAAAERARLDGVAAVVNDAVILRSEVEARLMPFQPQLQAIADPGERQRKWTELRNAVLGEMIDEELIVQAAIEAQLDVSEDELDSVIVDIKTQNNLNTAGLTQALELQGYTLDTYRRDLRKQLLRLRAVNQLVAPRVPATGNPQAQREAVDRETMRWVVKLRKHARIERP